jgi:hypothetical protein
VRIARVEKGAEDGYFYLHPSTAAAKPTTTPRSSSSNSTSSIGANAYGPYRTVVGTDGVFSVVRSSGLRGTYLAGDARWARDRWYDLGSRRVRRGADVAIVDGIALGRILVRDDDRHRRRRDDDDDDGDGGGGRGERFRGADGGSPPAASGHYCAWEIRERGSRRRRSVAAAAATAAFLASNFRRWGDALLRALGDSIFGDECVDDRDTRRPLVAFRLHPGVTAARYALLPPRLCFWTQISALLVAQTLAMIVLATIVYRVIIARRRRGSALSHLLCWAIAVPIGVGFPPMLARIFGVRNRAVMATTSAFPILVICRSLEAFFDFSPRYVEDSQWNYVVYYSSIIEYVFDTRTGSPAVARTSDVVRKGAMAVANLAVVSLLLSLVEVCSYRPFDATAAAGGGGGGGGGPLGTTPMMDCVRHIGNNLVLAILTSSQIAAGTAAFGFGICCLAGKLTMDVFDSPMFKSTSVSDFWGRRWNRLVGQIYHDFAVVLLLPSPFSFSF